MVHYEEVNGTQDRDDTMIVAQIHSPSAQSPPGSVHGDGRRSEEKEYIPNRQSKTENDFVFAVYNTQTRNRESVGPEAMA
jgi:hypothetical protein